MSLGMAKAKPGEAELEYRHNVKLIRQGSWPRSARIAVVNPKGGVGKTPTSLVLAGILATHRGGSVAVWDGADAAGTLHSRAEGFQGQPISDVVANPNAFSLPGTIAAAASTQSSLADVLGSPADREFTEDSVRRVLYVLDRTYRISVADTGNVVHSSAYQEILRQADILVVPTIVTADSVNEAVRFISKFHGRHSPLTPTPVVAAVLHHGGPTTPGLAPKVHELLTAAGAVSVVDIPFDPVIGAGTPITVSELSHESTLAWTRLATATVSYLTTN